VFLNKEKSPLIMGILNVTPDSFSDGGLYFDTHKAIERGFELYKQGADIVDIGGESSRPGAEPVEESEELRRIMPVVKELVSAGIPVSVDTVKEKVAQKAIENGAVLINDISGNLYPICAKYGCAWVAMHMLGNPKTMQIEPKYDDVVEEVMQYFERKISVALECGVKEIWVDPGIGFGKTLNHNLELIRALPRFVSLGYPVLIGVSKKSFLGMLISKDSKPADVSERLPATLAAESWCMINGAEMIRAHDVAELNQARRIMEKSGWLACRR
jgi:dihydropteroate synthase